MDLFSNFCNICYKIDNASLKDISEENMKHLSDTLITFVGHADIIKHNGIYLCQLCREELTRFDKFRDMCFSNLIQLRQRYINMKLELQDNVACAVQNTLQQFVYEEVRRKSSLEKSNCPVSISTDCHEIVKRFADANNDCSETAECEFVGACSDVSGINSVTECDESRVAVTNEEDMKNEILIHFENIKLEKFEVEADEDFDVCDTNIDTESDSSQMEFIKVEFDLKNERESNDSENFALTNFENESGEHANIDVKVPVVNYSEGNVNSGNESTKEELHMQEERSSGCFKLEKIENEFGNEENVAYEFANVHSVVNMEDCGKEYIRSGEGKAEMKLGSRDGNNKLTTATIDSKSNPNVLQASAYNLVYPSMEAHICAVCNKSFRTGSRLTRHARIHNDDGVYKCTVCNKTFTQLGHLTEHERIHSGERPYQCPVCNKTFARSSHLTEHERIHSGVRPYKCTVCNKTFTHSSSLARHARIHSGDRPHKCTVCNKTFTQPGILTEHERIHSDSPYKCTVCNKTFTHPGNLIRHERIHSGDRPYKCTVCNKTFTQAGTLTEHERTHSGNRPYKCTVCNKTFTHSSSLTKHARIHSGDRPYKCTVCNKTFTDPGNLITHKRIHSGDRPYKCTVCNKTFTHSSNLTGHKRIHRPDMPYKCTVCNKPFTQSSNLTKHERIHSGDRPYKCNVCNKTFTQLGHLAEHERIHSGARPYQCTVCNKTFSHRSSLTTHERIHSGDRPYKCSFCNKTFAHSGNLTEHERIHSGTRPYKCTVCNKTFTHPSNLNRHERVHS